MSWEMNVAQMAKEMNACRILVRCEILGFHGCDHEECCLLGCYAVWLLWERTFRRNISPP
jgi:hypothetical protein